METQTESRYKITEEADGFRIEGGADRTPVTVKLGRAWFEITSEGGGTDSMDGYDVFGLYDYYRISSAIAERLMRDWKAPARPASILIWDGSADRDEYTPVWLHRWAKKQTANAIGKRTHAQWKRLLGTVDPNIRDVNRAIFAATFGAANISTKEELYQDEYVVRDIINYRAAAVAARHVEGLRHSIHRAKVLNSSEWATIERLASTLGIKLRVSENESEAPTPAALVDSLHTWRCLFSPCGEDYHALNKTLTNLPGGVPHRLLCNLQNVHLARPITDRAELALVCAVAGLDVINRQNWHVFVYATRAQIAEALERVARFTHNEWGLRKTRHFNSLAQFLGDYPEKHTGNLVGLADKSIAWHRHQNEADIETQIGELRGQKAALPPVALPVIPGITFLDTPERIAEEGRLMEHCVASYARGAVNGSHYLFHVERAGEAATVQIGYHGEFIQAHGPGNQDNKAAGWGRRELKKWGATFPADIEVPPFEELPF